MTTPKNDKALREQGNVGKANNSNAKYSSRSTATEAQIERLVEMLRIRNRHTHELRKLGISHPAGRINDLKKRGYIFHKQLINTVDSDGFTHVNVALYSLISEPEAA
jgi:hypothetical protein